MRTLSRGRTCWCCLQNSRGCTTSASEACGFACCVQVKGFEAIRGVTLDAEQFSVENDCMTPTFKFKRPQLQKRYQVGFCFSSVQRRQTADWQMCCVGRAWHWRHHARICACRSSCLATHGTCCCCILHDWHHPVSSLCWALASAHFAPHAPQHLNPPLLLEVCHSCDGIPETIPLLSCHLQSAIDAMYKQIDADEHKRAQEKKQQPSTAPAGSAAGPALAAA